MTPEKLLYNMAAASMLKEAEGPLTYAPWGTKPPVPVPSPAAAQTLARAAEENSMRAAAGQRGLYSSAAKTVRPMSTATRFGQGLTGAAKGLGKGILGGMGTSAAAGAAGSALGSFMGSQGQTNYGPAMGGRAPSAKSQAGGSGPGSTWGDIGRGAASGATGGLFGWED